MKTIGRKIRELRMQRGMKLKELSQRVGVTASFLSQVERGVAVPSISSLKKISDAFGISITSFFGDGDKEEEKVASEFSPLVKKGQRKRPTPHSGSNLSPP